MSCGEKYRVDLIVRDDLWERIKPEGAVEGAGMLCGRRIMDRIEALGEFDYLHCNKNIHDHENETIKKLRKEVEALRQKFAPDDIIPIEADVRDQTLRTVIDLLNSYL